MEKYTIQLDMDQLWLFQMNQLFIIESIDDSKKYIKLI